MRRYDFDMIQKFVETSMSSVQVERDERVLKYIASLDATKSFSCIVHLIFPKHLHKQVVVISFAPLLLKHC